MTTLKTKIHTYSLDVRNPVEAEQYQQLAEKLRAQGNQFFNVLAMPGEKLIPFVDGEEIELETKFLFSNQWNTVDTPDAKGWHVFDWYEGIFPNRTLKQGHWLEITDEMSEIRRTTLVCGYCGAHYPNGNLGSFCSKCLDSPYLKEKELHLLRLMSVGLHFPKRTELTEQESAELLPRYVERQTIGKDSRAVQRKIATRAKVESKHSKAIQTAETEYKGMIWLLDHDVNIENCIFYSHVNTFSFGWQSPVSAEVKSKLLDLLCEFPFPYEITAEDGKVSTVSAA